MCVFFRDFDFAPAFLATSESNTGINTTTTSTTMCDLDVAITQPCLFRHTHTFSLATYLTERRGSAMADLEGLQSLSSILLPSASQPSKSGDVAEPAAKRTKLRHYDLLPAQVLNAMGCSGIEAVELMALWGKMQAGNKTAASFYEFCFDSSERHGIALSC